MTYIKLLTVLAGLALLTACGGAAPPNTENSDNDKTGGPAVPCDGVGTVRADGGLYLV